MPSISSAVYYASHPSELRSMIQWSTWHQPVHERDEETEAISLKHCFNFLDKTSRSFSAVIKELNPELLVPVCLFYLILRGLDTIEDDMTIPLQRKDPLLRDFYNILEEDGWTFEGNGSREKDRELLVKFHFVITEFQKIKSEYRNIIRDVTEKMGNGMAEYANNTEHNECGVNTVDEYQLYCHYVAGLVGEGLTRLFVESSLANPALLKRTDLSESMGQFLQQTNIIRDIREDMEDKRRFWPKEIWSKYVNEFDDLFRKDNQEAALRCSSEMILLALERADDCLFYLAGIKDQSVFNFAAIPQAMAIATLELCFRNPAIFERNVKITKGQACQLMIESSQNLQVLFGVFKQYARKIHKKNDPNDPNFLKISMVCGKIEQFTESIFPTQDPKAIVRAAGVTSETTSTNDSELVKKNEDAAQAKWDFIYMGVAVLGILAIISGFMLFLAWMLGARFDLALAQLWQGKFTKPTTDELRKLAKEHAHREL